MEHRFVRLCQDSDELITFLSFCTLGLVPSPSFCGSRPGPSDPSLSRIHLSFVRRRSHRHGISSKAKKRDCIVSAEHWARARLFAAIKNESDAFTDAFIQELHVRRDLFQVLILSERDPEQVVEMFGAGSGEALAAMRIRTFEAPSVPASDPPKGDGEWEVERTAFDLLYGTTKDNRGYLTVLALNKG
ncbi:hypothetical protein EDC04DRAFT_2630035 [Pisolithus marmoratus]|nr:hypothetical protein EDC04DRAFT_2630035 [Pisolithus marmoratus]